MTSLDPERQEAADYDLVYADWDRAVATVQSFMTGHLPVEPGSLLDAHCGTGLASDAAARLGWTVTAADASPAMLERVAARLPDVRRVRASPLTLADEAPGGFDAVVSVGNTLTTLHGDGVRTALEQLRRCTRDGGACMIAVRDFSERLKSAVWRDDPLARVAARFRYQEGGEILYTLDVDDADGSRSHDQLLYPLSDLMLTAALEDTGFRVRRRSRVAGRLVVAAVAG